MQLTKVHVLHAELVCRSGVHIGASDSEMHIGGIDNAVVKHPITQEPYIPGSSIKGKVRSLLEWRSGFVSNGPLGWPDYVNSHSDKVLAILKLFGVGGQVLTDAQAKEIGPTRLSFWDCSLLPEWISSVRTSEGSYTEVKTENSIDRIAGTAKNPRQTERVPADARFDFKVTVKVLDDENLLDTLLAGLKLLELDGIGGSVSRGYGKVKFEKLSLDGNDISADFDQIDPFAK
jgi:CRISPR-associated protein Csm3